MPRLEYSVEALNSLHKFYRADRIVYVEGPDDVPFWETIFDVFASFEVEIQDLGGSAELDKIVVKILTEGLDIIVARDADYLFILGEYVEHPNVVYTFGHSMENSVFTPEVVHRAARLLCKSNAITLTDCRAWLEHICDCSVPLTLCGIASRISDLGLVAFPDNAAKVLRDNNRCEIDSEKMTVYRSNLEKNVSGALLSRAEQIVSDSSRDFCDLIKGHFLRSATYHFLTAKMKNFGGAKAMSADVFFALSIQILGSALSATHPHADYYASAVKALSES
jgi:hypothetical protein